MAADDEIRRLILEVVGEDKVKSLREQVDLETASLLKLRDSMKGLTDEQFANDKGVQLATQSLARLNKELEAHGGKSRDLSQNARAASYAFQDFTSASGDLGQKLNAITNNIDGMLAGLTKYTGAIQIAVVAGVALYRNWDSIVRLFQDKNPFPTLADDAGVLQDKLSGVQKEMKALAENTSLTFDELEKFNQLREDSKNIEAAIADAKERQQAIDEAKKAKAPELEKEERERAEMMRGAIAPRKEEVVGQVAESLRTRERGILREQYQMLYEGASEAAGKGDRAKAMQLADQADAIKAKIDADTGVTPEQRERAQVLVGGVMKFGRAKELSRLYDLLGGEIGAGATPLGAAIREATPERFAERREDAADVARQERSSKLDEKLTAIRDKNEKAEKKRKLDESDAEMKAINEKMKIEEREKHQADRELEKQRKQHKRDQDKADRAANRAAGHQSSVLRGEFGKEAVLEAEGMLSQGMAPGQVAAMLQRFFGSKRGVSRQGAARATEAVMEKVMMDMSRNGGVGTELMKSQGRMVLQLQRAAEHQRRQLEHVMRDQRRFWDTASRRGN